MCWFGFVIVACGLQAPNARGQTNATDAGVIAEECVLRFAAEVDVPARMAGVLETVAVKVNDAVEADQVLAKLNQDQLLIQKRVASLQKKAADEKLADDLELQYAQTALAEATAELDANRSVFDEANGSVPLAQLRRLRLAVKRAQLEVDRERKQRRLAQIEIDLRAADLQMLEQRTRLHEVRSPLPGVVLQKYRSPGEWVDTGEPVARIARLDRLHAHCLMSIEKLPPHLCRDQAVTVQWEIAGKSQSLRGRVISVDTEWLSGRRYRFHAEIENKQLEGQWRLLPGTPVRLTVHPNAAAVRHSQAPRTGRR